MTKAELDKALQLRAEGKSYAQIGAALHYSRQHICNSLRELLPDSGLPNIRRGGPINPCRKVYPNIALWLIEHDCSYARLAKLTGSTTNTIYNIMHGNRVPSKQLIDSILAATGLTYEQAFGGDPA